MDEREREREREILGTLRIVEMVKFAKKTQNMAKTQFLKLHHLRTTLS